MSFKESSHACIGLIDRWLDYQTYIKEIPSVTVGIDVEGETIFKKSYGYKDLEDREKATPEMLYRIASHSKLFTASAIMRLFAAGRLRLDDPVREHLDWFLSPMTLILNTLRYVIY